MFMPKVAKPRTEPSLGSGRLLARTGSTLVRQPLGVAADDDRSEREADRVADRVLRTGEPRTATAAGESGQDGRPLPASVRSYLEPRIGHEFSRVRVHDDERAVRMSRALHVPPGV